MENQPDDSTMAVAAIENLLEKFTSELHRLESTKKGLEGKIASTRAKIEAMQEAVQAAKAAAHPKK